MAVSHAHDTTVRTHNAALDDASIGQLASRLSEQVSRLVHEELSLAQVEAKQKALKLGLGFGMFGAGGLLAFFGACCAVTAGILGLVNVVPGWAAALIVMGALFAVAGIMALTGALGVKKASPPVPTQAVESTKADVAAVREAVRR